MASSDPTDTSAPAMLIIRYWARLGPWWVLFINGLPVRAYHTDDQHGQLRPTFSTEEP